MTPAPLSPRHAHAIARARAVPAAAVPANRRTARDAGRRAWRAERAAARAALRALVVTR
jgi:hypothetical protein